MTKPLLFGVCENFRTSTQVDRSETWIGIYEYETVGETLYSIYTSEWEQRLERLFADIVGGLAKYHEMCMFFYGDVISRIAVFESNSNSECCKVTYKMLTS